MSMIQFDVLGRLLAEPIKSSPQVSVNPEMLGMAAWMTGKPAMAVARTLRIPILV